MRLLKTFFDTKSVLFSWVLSYILVLIIPLLFSVFMYSQSTKILKNEINRANIALLKQTQQEVDVKLDEVEKLAIQISRNDKVRSFLGTRQPLSDYEWYKINRMIADFNIYESLINFVDGFYVYFNNSDKIIAPYSTYDKDVGYNIFHENDNLDYDLWGDTMKQKHIRNFSIVPKKDDKNKNVILYMQSLFIDGTIKSSAVVTVIIDGKKIVDTVQGLQWMNEGIAFIINSNEQMVTFNNEHSNIDINNLKYSQMNKMNDTIFVKIDNKDYAVSYVTSQVIDWKYVYVLPINVFFEKYNYVQNMALTVVVICLLICGVAVYYLAKKNYNPIKQLLLAHNKFSGLVFSNVAKINEYNYIYKAIEKAQEEKEKTTSKLEQQNSALRSNFLNRIIKGKVENNIPIFDILHSLDIQFKTDAFAVILIYVEDYEELFKDSPNIEKIDKMSTVHFIIKNIVEELAGEKNKGYVVEVDDMLACLINVKSNNLKTAYQEIYDFTLKAQSFIREQMYIDITASISNIQMGISSITNAYQQAMNAMDYKMILINKSIICYEDIIQSKNIYDFPVEMEYKLLNNLKSNDAKSARELVGVIFEENFKKDILSVSMVKCLLFNIVNIIIKALQGSGYKNETVFFDDLNTIETLMKCSTIEELEKKIGEMFDRVCEFIVENNDKKDAIKDSIERYIKENYVNINLSINMIANEFGITADYLTKIYKKHSNESITDRINKVRLEKAKELLKDRRYTIGTVAQSVGYCNESTFFRLFKKYEGITPGKYRNILWNNETN